MNDVPRDQFLLSKARNRSNSIVLCPVARRVCSMGAVCLFMHYKEAPSNEHKEAPLDLMVPLYLHEFRLPFVALMSQGLCWMLMYQ